jgi:5-methylcytosine-specific restriction endonuclease McrA
MDKPKNAVFQDAKLRGYIVSALRRIWSWSSERSRAINRAKVGRNAYQCELCKCIKRSLKSMNCDHRVPVGPSPYSRLDKKGRTWDDYMNALFCSADNLQVICKECHKDKTTLDVRAMRE